MIAVVTGQGAERTLAAFASRMSDIEARLAAARKAQDIEAMQEMEYVMRYGLTEQQAKELMAIAHKMDIATSELLKVIRLDCDTQRKRLQDVALEMAQPLAVEPGTNPRGRKGKQRKSWEHRKPWER